MTSFAKRLKIAAAACMVGGLVLTIATSASAHSNAACKFEALQACLDMQGQHHLCVEYAVTLCAGHSHSGGSVGRAGTDYHAPGTGGSWSRIRRVLVGPGGFGRSVHQPRRVHRPHHGHSLRYGGGNRMQAPRRDGGGPRW